MKKYSKSIMTCFFIGMITIPSILSAGCVLAEDVNANNVNYSTSATVSAQKLNENQFYNLDDILNKAGVTEEKKVAITQAILQEVQEENSFRSYSAAVRGNRQTTVLKRLSHAQVQAIVNSNDPTSTLIGMLPLVGNLYSALAYFNDSQFRTAARNGWGMEYVIIVDPNNPTSTGMSFAWRYVK